jgi:predicted nucleic acid-binding protein
LGILVEAKIAGIIPAVRPLLLKIRETNFRISTKLELMVLKLAGES